MRPARELAAALAGMGGLATTAVLLSEMPRLAAIPLAGASLAYAGWLARREWRRKVEALVIPPGAAPVTVDAQPCEGFEVEWQWPLAIFTGRLPDGSRWRRLSWLGRAEGRMLRLAMLARRADGDRRSVAP